MAVEPDTEGNSAAGFGPLEPVEPGQEQLFDPGQGVSGAAGRRAPSLAVRVALRARHLLLALADRVIPPQFAVFDLSLAGTRSTSLATVARLGVADLLGERPRSAGDLAGELGVGGDALHRVMRALVLDRVFTLDRSGRFSLTALGERLRTDHPESVRAWVVYFHTRSNQSAWHELDDVVRTGLPSFPRRFGRSVWAWFDEHPEEGRLFASAMRRLTEEEAPGIVAAYPWPERGTVCDLAGGSGTLLSHILQARPHLHGVLVEAPLILDEAEEVLQASGVRHRVDLAAGDLFHRVVAKADVYVLKNVLHDWGDDDCLRILATTRATMPTGATLVVIELLQERNRATYPASLTDLQMMVVCDAGRERSRGELQQLLRRAGFEPGPTYLTPTGSGLVTGRT